MSIRFKGFRAEVLVWIAAATVVAAAMPAQVARAQAGDASAVAGEEADPFFDDDGFVGPQVPDPLEPVNRGVFAANMTLDRLVMDPIARFYGRVTPEPVKQSVRGVFSNLNRPVVFVNELLQCEPRRAAQTLGRFVLNSTLGVAGMFDPAAELGWGEYHADFGQTLGVYGVGPGIYHVLPVVGPSTTRDAFGMAVDMMLRIDTWFLPLTGQLMIGGSFGISQREDKSDELAELRKSSLDFYAAIRSAYLQSREALVQEARAR